MKYRDSIYAAKTKALISCTFTVQLICAFVFAKKQKKNRFFHDPVQMALIHVLSFKPLRDKFNNLGLAPSKDSDQPGQSDLELSVGTKNAKTL